jgi:hypothetical protein
VRLVLPDCLVVRVRLPFPIAAKTSAKDLSEALSHWCTARKSCESSALLRRVAGQAQRAMPIASIGRRNIHSLRSAITGSTLVALCAYSISCPIATAEIARELTYVWKYNLMVVGSLVPEDRREVHPARHNSSYNKVYREHILSSTGTFAV